MTSGRRDPGAGRGRTALSIAFALAASGFLVSRVVGEWDEFRAAASEMSLPLLGLAFVLAAFGMTGIAVGWQLVLRQLGVAQRLGITVADYYLGELGKYIPGGVWPVLGRGELTHRRGVDRTTAYTSVVLSLSMLYVMAAGMVAVALPLTGQVSDVGVPWWAAVAAGTVAGLVGLQPGVASLLSRLLGPLLGNRSLPAGLGLRRSTPALAMFAGCWTAIGMATVVVGKAAGEAAVARVFFAALLSWLAGFLAVPVPGGIGVREAVFVSVAGLAAGPGLAIAVVTRLLFVFVDVGGAVVGWSVRAREAHARGAQPTGTEPAS